MEIEPWSDRQIAWLLPSALEIGVVRVSSNQQVGEEKGLLAVARSDLANVSSVIFLQHNKSSQWCQEHFLNYKGLVRAATVREQLKKLLVKFQVPKMSSEGGCGLPLPGASLPLFCPVAFLKFLCWADKRLSTSASSTI